MICQGSPVIAIPQEDILRASELKHLCVTERHTFCQDKLVYCYPMQLSFPHEGTVHLYMYCRDVPRELHHNVL